MADRILIDTHWMSAEVLGPTKSPWHQQVAAHSLNDKGKASRQGLSRIEPLEQYLLQGPCPQSDMDGRG